MSTRTITGTVLDSAGNAATGTVRFVLERGTWSAGEHAIPDETTATLTAGAFSITVYTPARYKVYLPTGYHFSVNIPAGSATTIEALRLADEDLPDLSTVLDDFLEALEINGLEYAAGQTPRWNGDSWEQADYYTETEVDRFFGGGTVYYIDATGGSDAAAGTSAAAAWQTITKVNAAIVDGACAHDPYKRITRKADYLRRVWRRRQAHHRRQRYRQLRGCPESELHQL
jgi:hypothetical protein